MIRKATGWAGAAALLMAAAGCALFEDPGPDTARLRLDGAEGAEVRLIISTRFATGTAVGNRPVPVEVLQAETTRVQLPFEARYDISGPQRFLARVVRLDLEGDQLVVRGWIDGDERFLRTGTTSPADSVLQFVYAFRSFRAGGGGTL